MSKPTLRRKEVDAYSTSSSRASRGSGEKNRKKSGFSITRLFCRRPSSRKSVRSTRSFSDVETRSVSSLQPSQSDRDMQAASAELSDDLSQQKRAKDWVECPLCLMYQPKDNFPPISTCHHRSCRLCLRQYLKIEITESRVNITCPECSERFHPNDIKMILSDKSLMRKYEEFMLRRVLVMNPDTRWCPAPDCGFAVIATGCASCPKLRCERPGCGTHFCYHCKQYWHPNQTCDAARAERSSNMRSSSISYSHESGSQKDDIKPCPRCGVFIVKMDDGSCNHVTCAVCGSEFCWLCMKEISDLHYLSPSGCTFWGKKPWSRKKKILWQLGTLVGAPVGIALVAGIAVPAIVIGVPIWVGRKLHAKYEAAHKHKRNLIVTGGVMGAVLISPLLAGLAVGIGVPILLAYVYCVVPISLCRSGGCGVTTNSGGVRFEFEEQNEGAAAAAGVSGPYSGPDANSVGANSHQAGNPSIGPSIGEMSLGMTNSLSASGSNIDRVGILREESDRESASNRAIAGESLNGSITGSAVAGPSGYHNRLEVQADVATNPTSLQKRSSMSSESANFSLDAKSATVSFGDDASTKALAGSICNRDKDDQSVIMPPLEVQVDVVNTSARYRHSSSASGAVPRSPPPSTRSCYRHTSSTTSALPRSSPTSSRSVNFLGEEILEADSRTKHYKRQSASVGDAIHERTTLERRSARSLLTADSSLDALARADSSNKRTCASVRRSSAQSSLSSDTRCYDKNSACAGAALPEVESDHPDLASGFTRINSSSSGSDNTETASAIGEPYSPCFESLAKIDDCLRTDSMLSAEQSSDCSSTDSTVPLNKQSPKLSFLKRHSCEVALNEGVFTFPQRESKL